MTENEHPKSRTRGRVSRQPAIQERWRRGARRSWRARLRSLPNWDEKCNFKAKSAYQNYRKMVEICTLLPGFLYMAL